MRWEQAAAFLAGLIFELFCIVAVALAVIGSAAAFVALFEWRVS